ncbi:MAG: hypothetical protein HUJ71_02350 [Pseudobutyrivibrio sp.]|nr:hypothetical protein [Pseudobutyrivibrio sp.]
MRNVDEFEKLKTHIDANIPSRLDSTLDRCLARANQEREIIKMRKIVKAAICSLVSVLSVSGVTYAATTGGFARMLGHSEKNAQSYSEYISESTEVTTMGDFSICVENTMVDIENGLGAIYCSIENTNPDTDYTLCLYTSGEEMKQYRYNEKATKYATISTNMGASSMFIDYDVTTKDKQYVLLLYTLLADSEQEVIPSVEIWECDEYGDGSLNVPNTLGSLTLTNTIPVKKRVFASLDGSTIELSPISIRYCDFDATRFEESALDLSDECLESACNIMLKKTRIVSKANRTDIAYDLIRDYIYDTDYYHVDKPDSIYYAAPFTCIYDVNNVDKVVVDEVEYTLKVN